MTKIARSGSISQRHDGFADPDPHQNVMDSEHCCECTYVDSNDAGEEGHEGALLQLVAEDGRV
jgi:hypothetical protein